MDNIFRLPTKEKSTKLGEILIFQDRIEFDESVYMLENISIIHFHSSIITTNFMTSKHIHFFITGKNEKDSKMYKVDIINPKKQRISIGGLTHKSFEAYSCAYSYVAKSTFKNRLLIYIDYLNNKGFFPYANCEFRINGDIFKKGKFIANLGIESTKNTISCGSSWRGLNNSSKTPYEFTILSDLMFGRIKILGFELGLKLKFSTYENHDIFNALIINFLKYKKYPSSIS